MRLRICSLIVLALLAAGFSTAVKGQETMHAALHARLEAQLNQVASNLDGVMGYAIKDLNTGEMFLLRPDTVFPQASSIKLTILLELLRQAQEGKLSLDEEHKVSHAETVGGSGILFMMGDGTATLSLRDLATLMVVLSDNSATNIIIRRVGMENVNANNERLGLRETRLRRLMMDLAAAQRGEENVSTPREMMTLLEDVHDGQALNPDYTKEYFRILALPKESEFHTALPDTVTIADKPGALEAVRCDSGIIEIPGHPFVMSVMTTYLKNEQEGEAAIEQVARLAYSYFDRLARSSAYGRVVSEK